MDTDRALLLTVAVTTICWVSAAFLAPETDRATLVAFCKRVKPFGPGWREIREEAGITEAEMAATHENIPLALLGWLAGCVAIWSSLFTVGNFIYGRLAYAFALLAVFIVSAMVLIWVIAKLWGAK